MGLLRKAAIAGVRGEPGSATPGRTLEQERPRGPGLLRRSLKARESRAPAEPALFEAADALPIPETSPAPLTPAAPSGQLTIELAGEEPVQVPVPVRVEAPPKPVGGPFPSMAPTAAAESSTTGRPLADVVEEVQTAVASLKSGVELPSRLFTALSSLLGIRKGAFLLYDAVRLVYAPWAQRGFDQTTRHRLRVPLGANEAWNALANGRPLLLGGAPTLAAFQPFFSAREFASVARLILVPFIAEDKLIAVLLITEMESPLATDDDLTECLARAAEAGAPRVQDARAARVAGQEPGGPHLDAAAPRDDLARLLSSLPGSHAAILLVSLSLEDLSREVLSAHEDLDPFRLHEDLQFFLGSFLADAGRALSVRPGRFTLALPDFDASAMDLFGHQLSLFLRGLFGNAEAAEGRASAQVLKTASWPADGADLRALVGSLSS
jgi:hypothetical protein